MGEAGNAWWYLVAVVCAVNVGMALQSLVIRPWLSWRKRMAARAQETPEVKTCGSMYLTKDGRQMASAKQSFISQIFGVFWRALTAKACWYGRLTSYTAKRCPTSIFWRDTGQLEDRSLAVLVAICTYVMRRFAIAHGILQRVNRHPTIWPCHFIALLLCFPCFHISNLFFKFAYMLNHRRLSRICREYIVLSRDNLLVKFDSLGLDLGQRLEVYQSHCNIASHLKATNSGCDLTNVHDFPPEK